MELYSGKSISNETAIGKILFYRKREQRVAYWKIEDVEAEIARYEAAKQVAAKQLGDLYEKALAEVGEDNARIFEAHVMMLSDEEYDEEVQKCIRQEGVNAERAVEVTGEKFADLFLAMQDEYFKARVADVKDITNRLIAVLEGTEREIRIGEEPVILVVDELTPSEVVQLDRNKVIALVTHHGSLNSHTAILARTMNIPTLIGVEIQEAWNGKMAVIDGKQGKLIIEPDDVVFEQYMETKKREEVSQMILEELKGQPDITKDGREVPVYANIGSISDVEKVLENDAAGIGLFRTEFLYLEKKDYPTEEEQFTVYKTVVQKMKGKKIIFRTLDIGADKQADYFNLEKEENPAMGYRAIRICLDREDIFKTQLRALYRASAFGAVSIMFPMIISVEEVQKIKRICEEVKAEFTENKVQYGEASLGIMIETPAAVMISDMLAKEVDFFSIGTNDLAQYTLAVDRQNEKLESIYDAQHPAIFKMIQMVIDNGHKEGCRVGICGELGADTTLTEKLVKMGIDEISVFPDRVLPVRKRIRETSVKKEITVIGPAIIDVLAGPADENVFQTGSQAMNMTKLSFGGDALNESVVLSRMGKQVELISKVGNDEAGARVLDYIKANGLAADSIRIEENLATGINIVLIDKDGERHFLTNPEGSLRKLTERDILPYLEGAADIVCFASMFVSPLIDINAMERVFWKIKEKPGRILVVDMTKAKNGERMEDIKKLLPYVDYILPNQDEIALLTGKAEPLQNAKLLVEAGVSCAVVKCGSNGCIIHTKDVTYDIPAYPVKEAVDTTGAGDCFAAGFLWGLSSGMNLDECGRFACAAASCAVEAVGATEGIQSVEEPMRRYTQ